LYELYKPDSNKYPDSTAETLNDYMRKRIASEKDPSGYPIFRSFEDLEVLLGKVSRMVAITFNGNHFKSFSAKKERAEFSTSLNQSVFDVQMLGFVEYEEDEIKDLTDVIYDTFLDLSVYDKAFIDAVTRSTNHKVSIRVGIWQNSLKRIFEDPDSFRQNFSNKKDAFINNPICSATGVQLSSFEDADYYVGKLYHKCHSPRSESSQTTTRKTPKTPIAARLDGSEYIFDDVYDLVDFLMESISDRIQDNEFEVQRLTSLEFVGTLTNLSAKSKRPQKRFKKIDLILNNKQLHIDIGGSRSEIKQMLQDIAKLFSFTSDFQIID
jgi:hypothetical protein